MLAQPCRGSRWPCRPESAVDPHPSSLGQWACSRTQLGLTAPYPHIVLMEMLLARSYLAPMSMAERAKAIARISRISDELKLISFSRFKISLAVRGISSRKIGLMWMMTTSVDWQP